jgi:hypothetical protein
MADPRFKKLEQEEYETQQFIDDWFDIGHDTYEAGVDQAAAFEEQWKQHNGRKKRGKEEAKLGFGEGWIDAESEDD